MGTGLSGVIRQMMLSSYFHCKLILKISQATGLRDLDCGCTSEPFGFIKAVASTSLETLAGVWEVNDDSAKQD